MTPPSSRRPQRLSRPDRAGVARGRRSTRSGTPTTGPGRRIRSAGTPVPANAGQPAQKNSTFARQIAILGVVLCAVALSLAYPLRNYLDQRAALAAAVAEQRALEQQVDELKIQQAALSDPDYIRAQAKQRLQYVTPGDTVYVVQAPQTATVGDPAGVVALNTGPWYATLWDTLSADVASGSASGPVDQTVPADVPIATDTPAASTVTGSSSAPTEPTGATAVTATP